MTIDHETFVAYAQDYIEAMVDQAIAAQSDVLVRLSMMQHREAIVGKILDTAAIVDLKRRLAEAEERQLRLVS